MGRPLSTGVNAVRRKLADGSTTRDFYHRRTGQLLGREREGMTLDQAITRREELDGDVRVGPRPGSFGELATLYLASPKFQNRAGKTKKEYRAHIELLRELWESVPVTGITRVTVRALHSRFQDRPWQGNALIRTLRLVLNYGIRELQMAGLPTNPANHPELYETPPREQIWDQHQIDAFLAAASDNWRMRLAIAVLLYTVQRPGDVLALTTPQMWQGPDGRSWIRLRQAKTSTAVDVPCHAMLAAEIERAEAAAAEERRTSQDRRRIDSVLLLASPTGRPWSYRNFARTWDRVRRRANWRLAKAALADRGGLPPAGDKKARTAAKAAIRAGMLGDLQRRDLRRTGIVQLAIAGATVPQIAALSGHKVDQVQKILDVYLPRRGEVALGGVERWENAGAGGRVVTLSGRKQT